MIARITKTTIRTYSGTGQRKAYAEWVNAQGVEGRTEGEAHPKLDIPMGGHMAALFKRGRAEGAPHVVETW